MFHEISAAPSFFTVVEFHQSIAVDGSRATKLLLLIETLRDVFISPLQRGHFSCGCEPIFAGGGGPLIFRGGKMCPKLENSFDFPTLFLFFFLGLKAHFEGKKRENQPPRNEEQSVGLEKCRTFLGCRNKMRPPTSPSSCSGATSVRTRSLMIVVVVLHREGSFVDADSPEWRVVMIASAATVKL